MAIIATSNAQEKRELIEAGLHAGRCVKILEIGTCTETIMGTTKQLKKVNFSWELALTTKIFEESKGPQPLMISKEFTISMALKSNLRAFLGSWRGKPFSDEEAAKFDITALLGVPCMLNITHKPSKADPTRIFEDIVAITPPMKGLAIPPQVNPSIELSYDKWDEKLFEALPEFLQKKMKLTPEYQLLKNPPKALIDGNGQPLKQDLPADFYTDEVQETEDQPLF